MSLGKEIYKMNSNLKGFCIIFNMIKFENDHYEERIGWMESLRITQDIFKRFNFKVLRFIEYTNIKEKIIQIH